MMDQPDNGFEMSQGKIVTLIRKLCNVRYVNDLPVCHSISSFDCALEMACSISHRGTAF